MYPKRNGSGWRMRILYPDDLDPLGPITPSTIPSVVKHINDNYFTTSSIKFGNPNRSMLQTAKR